MNSLKVHKFSDLYEMCSGISSTPKQAGHGSPFLSFSAVFNNHFLPERFDDLMQVSDLEQKKYSIQEGDIFLTRTSETIDELGMSSVATKDYPDATYSGFLKRLRPTQKDVTYHKFMGFYLRSKLFRKTMTNNAVLTLRASLNEDIFSYLNLIIPAYNEQVKIGDLLYLLNKKIDLNNRINAELEKMVKTIYDYWFIQFDFSDQNGKPYKSSGGKMIYNNNIQRSIPESWIEGTLENLGEIVGGSTPSTKNEKNFSNKGISWITPNDLSKNLGNKYISKGAVDVSPDGIKCASLKIYPKGTVLLSSRAPIGYMAIARNELTTNQGFKSFIPNKSYSTEFIFYCLQSSLKAITQNASGSTFKEISGSTLRTIKVILPEKKISDKFTSKVESVFLRQNILEQETQELKKLRDWLLPILMSNQVKVL